MRAAHMFYLIAGLFALSAPFLGIYPVFMMKLLCFAMFACAFNLLLGFSGMLSFGHAAFFGFSAYVTAWLAAVHGWGAAPATLAVRSSGVARTIKVQSRPAKVKDDPQYGFTKALASSAPALCVGVPCAGCS